MSRSTNNGGNVNGKQASQWYEQWLLAWNEQRPEMCQDLLTEDFVLSTPTLRNADGALTGPSAAADYLRYVLAMYPDLVWEMTGPPMFAKESPRAAFTWKGTGHFLGRMDPPGIDGNGNAFEFTGVEVFEFRGERACHLDVSYDLLGLLKQTGVIGSKRTQ
jgi:SnoaL-like protein